MKNIFILAAILLTNTLFSQNNNEFSTTVNQVNFETDIKENYYLNESDKFLNLFTDVNFMESNSKMNTERKFLMKSLEKENILSSNLKKESIIVTKSKRSSDDVNSLITDTKSTFVKTIIEDKLKEELLKSLNANEALTYGDKNIDLYVEYEEMRNKLIKSYEINDSVEFQIGKSVYPYLNKILKTEIDKTLRNSLNLFVVNF